MKNDIIDLLIIGSGPAGYTAAIYASRAGLNPILYQGKEPGGQLTITSDVENYPGYPNGIQGPEMMLDFQKQAERFGTIVKGGFIKSVDFSKYPFEIIDDNDKILNVNSVIISTGASAKWLGLESEKKFNGNGVSACAVCDGFFFKDQIVAVVGGGDTAAEESLYLSKITKKVFLIVRRNELRASKIMQKRVFDNENIEIIWNSEVKDVLGDDKVDSVLVLNNSNNTTSKLNISGLFIAIGHKPNTDIFKNYIDLDDNGYILTKPGTTVDIAIAGGGAGIGTAIDRTAVPGTTGGDVIYYVNEILRITTNTTITVPESTDVAYTNYEEVVVEDSVDLIIDDGDQFVVDVLGLSTYTTNVTGAAPAATPVTGPTMNIAGIATMQHVTVTKNTGNTAGVITAKQGSLPVNYYGNFYGDGKNIQNLVSGVGIITAGGTVGTGATFLDLRGAGVSTCTVSAGIATINIEGGGGGGSLARTWFQIGQVQAMRSS